MEEIKPGKYRHYKGKFYEVIGLAKDSENLDVVVVYKALYASNDFGGSKLWTRPLKMFLEKVKFEGKEVPRFEFVGNQ